MPKFHVSFARVESILRGYDLISDAFVFGDRIYIPFISAEFSIVMGLKDIGQHIDLDMPMDSDIVRRHFQGKSSIVRRKNIAEKLDMLADKQEDIDVDDFVKLYIIFVFNCILFPTSNCTTPRFLLPYVDDLSKICSYAWGNATYRFLNEEILKHVRDGEGRKKYFDGCVIGLMAWVYERIPSLGKPCAMHIFPRFFRWVDSKIPNDLDAASIAFISITKNKVLPIYPLPEERILVSDRDNDNEAQIKRLDAIIRAQEEEIREMKRIFHFDNMEGKNRVSKGKGKGRIYAKENDDLIPRDAHEFDECADETLKAIERGDKVHFDGYDGGSDLVKKERENVEESDEYMTFDAQKFDTSEKLNFFETSDKVSFEGNDVDRASEGKREKNVEKDAIESEQAMEDSHRDIADHNIEVNSKTEADKEEKTELKTEISSIALDVMSRQDRRLKGKEKDFVTPPSTTQKKRKLVGHRVADKPIELEDSELVVMQIAQAVVEEANKMDDELLEYVGRSSISDSDRNIVDTFLKRYDMREDVWRSMKIQVSRNALCDLLYDKELVDDVLNAHLNILSRNFVRYGNPPKIWVLNSVVQAEFQKKLPRTKKEKNLMFVDTPRFIDSLSRSSRCILGELNANVLNESRYILMPLNTKFHWFLLVLDTVAGKFIHMNSLWSPQTKGFVKIFAKFISCYIKNSLQYPAPSAEVDCRYSRQQSGLVDCGVFVCLWAEAFTQDDHEFWGYVNTCSIQEYRAHMAATILADEYGMLHHLAGNST